VHEIPHEVPSHVGAPFATVGQTAQEAPQALTLVGAEHAPPQTRDPDAHAVATQALPEQPNAVALAAGHAAQAPPHAR
jgi:hypothetical protein